MKKLFWNIYVNNKFYDRIAFSENMHEDDIEKYLINNGYPENIVIHCPACQPVWN